MSPRRRRNSPNVHTVIAVQIAVQIVHPPYPHQTHDRNLNAHKELRPHANCTEAAQRRLSAIASGRNSSCVAMLRDAAKMTCLAPATNTHTHVPRRPLSRIPAQFQVAGGLDSQVRISRCALRNAKNAGNSGFLEADAHLRVRHNVLFLKQEQMVI